MKILRGVIQAAALFGAQTAMAGPVSFSTSGAVANNIGNQFGAQYDTLSLSALNGTINGPGTYILNDLVFAAGRHPNSPSYVFNGTIGESLTIGSVTRTFSLAYADAFGGPADVLSITGGLVLQFGDFNVMIHDAGPLTSAGAPSPGDLTASVAVPEPGSLAALAAGLVCFALVLRLNRAKKSPPARAKPLVDLTV